MHAPSPMTKPARVASNGPRRERRVVLLGDEAAHRAEAGEDERMMHASVPPASTTSASPRLMISAASPIAVEPVAHAETGA